MGCIYPVKIKNEHYRPSSIYMYERHKYYFVPCGKCLACMISKRTWLNTACEYEYNKYGCGAFVTLTYDNEHYEKLYDEEIKDFRADYRDFQLFMKRLRQNIYRKYGVRHEYKYLAVSELGGKNGRIHYHVLFFGLDFRNNELDIFNAWEQGITDCKPIKAGGINYVLKYMDKYEMRNKKEGIRYDYQKPFMKYSKGLGKGFIDKNLDFIIKHNGCYDRGDGKLHTLPPYWCNRLRIKPIVDHTETRKQMVAEKYTRKNGYMPKWNEIGKTEVESWEYGKTILKTKQMINESRKAGIPQEDLDDFLIKTHAKEKLCE